MAVDELLTTEAVDLKAGQPEFAVLSYQPNIQKEGRPTSSVGVDNLCTD